LFAEEPNMEPDLSPRATIAMERRLWKVNSVNFQHFKYSDLSHQVRHSLNSLPAPGHVMSRLFGNDEQWRYAQQVLTLFLLLKITLFLLAECARPCVPLIRGHTKTASKGHHLALADNEQGDAVHR
jgi:hypothetical protein